MSNTVGYSISCGTPVRYNLTQGEDVTGNGIGYALGGCSPLPMLWWNTEQTAYCQSGYHGTPITVASGTFSSPVSQQAADALAIAYAEGQLSCEPDAWEVDRALATGIALPHTQILASDGYLYVCGYSDGTVWKVSTTVGGKEAYGTGIGIPYGIVQGTDGYIYVAGYLDNTIWRLTASGVKEAVATSVANGLTRIAQADDGNFYVCGYLSDDLVRVTPSGVKTVMATGLGGPQGLIQASDGKLYVSGSNSDTLFSVTLAGVTSTVCTGIDRPTRLAEDFSGKLLVCGNYDSTLWSVDKSTGDKTALSTGITSVEGIAISVDGSTFVTGSPNRIVRVSPSGEQTSSTYGISSPHTVVPYLTDTLYVTGLEDGTVWEVHRLS